MFGSELGSGVLCSADEYQVSHVESVRFDVLVGALHIPILIFAEDL